MRGWAVTKESPSSPFNAARYTHGGDEEHLDPSSSVLLWGSFCSSLPCFQDINSSQLNHKHIQSSPSSSSV